MQQITLIRPDGVHVLTKATLQQMADDETLLFFAEGLLSQAFNQLSTTDQTTRTLAEALHQSDLSQLNALLTALLVLDAEVNAFVDDENRVFPLPGFLSYRHNLPLDRYPLNTMRLPPLNPGGYYVFVVLEEGCYLAVRMDIHPELKITGHVRIAIGGQTRPPQRLLAVEHRLDRQKLDRNLIEAAITAENEELPVPLTVIEQIALIGVLKNLIEI